MTEENPSPMLVPIDGLDDIPARYRDTPIADLLAYHNLDAPLGEYTSAAMLLAMCMDNRKKLRMPKNFAYVLRTGGANVQGLEFPMSFAVGIARVEAIAVIGHDQCGMAAVPGRREPFVTGLVEHAGWEASAAEELFDRDLDKFAIGDPAPFVVSQVKYLRCLFPTLHVAPMFYRIADNRLYLVREE